MFPIVTDLRGRTVLVVGAGPVGRWKTKMVLEAGGSVRLVDPNPAAGVNHPLATLIVKSYSPNPAGMEHPLITRVVEPYSPVHLDGVVLAFACANPEVDAGVVADARSRGVWACDAAGLAHGDFALPAIVRRGGLTIAVSTGGAAPSLSARIAQRFREEFDDAYADWVRILGEVRTAVLAAVPDPEARSRLLRGFAEPIWLERIRTAGPDVVLAEMLHRVAAV